MNGYKEQGKRKKKKTFQKNLWEIQNEKKQYEKVLNLGVHLN